MLPGCYGVFGPIVLRLVLYARCMKAGLSLQLGASRSKSLAYLLAPPTADLLCRAEGSPYSTTPQRQHWTHPPPSPRNYAFRTFGPETLVLYVEDCCISTERPGGGELAHGASGCGHKPSYPATQLADKSAVITATRT